MGVIAGFGAGYLAGRIYGQCSYHWALAGECGCKAQRQAMSMSEESWKSAHGMAAGVIGGISAAIAAVAPIGLIAIGAGMVIVSGWQFVDTVNVIKNETGLTKCTITEILLSVAGIVVGAMGIEAGVRAFRASGNLLSWVRPYSLPKGKAALDKLYLQSRPGKSPNIWEAPGEVAKDWFDLMADPNSITPHPKTNIANQGGLMGKIPEGGVVLYRPITGSGDSGIDISNAPGYPAYMKFHFPP
jgi:hypothetical protein